MGDQEILEIRILNFSRGLCMIYTRIMYDFIWNFKETV